MTLFERSFPALETLEKSIRDLFLSFRGQCQTPISFSGSTWRDGDIYHRKPVLPLIPQHWGLLPELPCLSDQCWDSLPSVWSPPSGPSWFIWFSVSSPPTVSPQVLFDCPFVTTRPSKQLTPATAQPPVGFRFSQAPTILPGPRTEHGGQLGLVSLPTDPVHGAWWSWQRCGDAALPWYKHM